MAGRWGFSCFFGRSCDPLANVQKRIQVYEITAPTATATSFEALPHKVTLAINGCNALPASHTSPLLYRISRDRVMAKRTTSRPVVRCLRPKVQYLFKKKLLTAPLLYAMELYITRTCTLFVGKRHRRTLSINTSMSVFTPPTRQ